MTNSTPRSDMDAWLFLGGAILLLTLISVFSKDDPSQGAESCRIAAEAVYQDALELAIEDPDKWKLAGYKSASDYAETSRRSTLARCMQ